MNQELKKQIAVREKEEKRMAERRRERNNINGTDWDKIAREFLAEVKNQNNDTQNI